MVNGDPRGGEERLIGGDTGLAHVMARARMVCRSNAPVLLFGETGTGKEIVARAIHEHSTFRSGPFRRVNCGAIAPELIDSELFGHEQGAFTGAVTRRKGWFEQADGGTLFLDEVGELPPAAQVRLLRVVQDAEVVRVGGERPVHVTIRIVAATHRDLPAMVERQTFREDLYYRLSVFPIVIPPLRDRPSDIRAFAEYFAERAANRFGLKPVPVSEDDVAVLAAYQWPGNVREIAAVMDRAVLIGQGQTLNVGAALGHDAGLPPIPPAQRAPVVVSHDPHRAARRGRSPSYRGRASRSPRSGRGTPWRRAAAPDQSPHVARANAQAENRLAGVQAGAVTLTPARGHIRLFSSRRALPRPILAPQLPQQILRAHETVVEEATGDRQQITDEWITHVVPDARPVLPPDDNIVRAEDGEVLRDRRLLEALTRPGAPGRSDPPGPAARGSGCARDARWPGRRRP